MRKVLLTLILALVFLGGGYVFPQYGQDEERERKLEFEVSGGLSFISKHDDFYSRIAGNEILVNQYSQYYGVTLVSESGEIGKIKYFIPLNLSLNYKLSRNTYLKIGFEFSSGKTTTTQRIRVQWDDTVESYSYDYDYRLASLMPYIGLETRFSSFGIYATVGYNFTDFTLNQYFEYTVGQQKLNVADEYDTRGKTIAFTLGGKYIINMGKKNHLLIKAEFLYLKVGSFTGDKVTNGSYSSGETFSETSEGTIYIYEIDPYEIEGFNYWELYQTIPDGTNPQGAKELSINLSSLRIMIGFSF